MLRPGLTSCARCKLQRGEFSTVLLPCRTAVSGDPRSAGVNAQKWPRTAHNISTLSLMIVSGFRSSDWGRMEHFSIRAITALMAAFLKIAARISAVGTLAVAALILGWQARSWILTDEWDSFPISRALALAGLQRTAVYVTASASDRRYSLDFQTICDWFLDFPAAGFLLAVATVLFGFSVFAASVEKQFATTEK